MPTPAGRPKAGETWQMVTKLPPDWTPHISRFKVVERTSGDYFALRVEWIELDGRLPKPHERGVRMLVDAAYFLSRGQLEWCGY